MKFEHGQRVRNKYDGSQGYVLEQFPKTKLVRVAFDDAGIRIQYPVLLELLGDPVVEEVDEAEEKGEGR